MIKLLTSYGKTFANRIAKIIHNLSGGRVTPNMITTTSVIGYLFCLYLVYQGYPRSAAILFLGFGFFDALDGALARHQKKSSEFGLFYDSFTDRIKEILLFFAILINLYNKSALEIRDFTVFSAYITSSLMVSYTNAMGNLALSSAKSKSLLNQIFRGGVSPYQVRIVLIALGLASAYEIKAALFVFVLNIITINQRFYNIYRCSKENRN